jgi:hypothetical protein
VSVAAVQSAMRCDSTKPLPALTKPLPALTKPLPLLWTAVQSAMRCDFREFTKKKKGKGQVEASTHYLRTQSEV